MLIRLFPPTVAGAVPVLSWWLKPGDAPASRFTPGDDYRGGEPEGETRLFVVLLKIHRVFKWQHSTGSTGVLSTDASCAASRNAARAGQVIVFAVRCAGVDLLNRKASEFSIKNSVLDFPLNSM